MRIYRWQMDSAHTWPANMLALTYMYYWADSPVTTDLDVMTLKGRHCNEMPFKHRDKLLWSLIFYNTIRVYVLSQKWWLVCRCINFSTVYFPWSVPITGNTLRLQSAKQWSHGIANIPHRLMQVSGCLVNINPYNPNNADFLILHLTARQMCCLVNHVCELEHLYLEIVIVYIKSFAVKFTDRLGFSIKEIPLQVFAMHVSQ